MKKIPLLTINPFVCLLSLVVSGLIHVSCHASDTVLIPVDSPAFIFSPGNWTGNEGRGGGVFRQTWYPGAYFQVTWTTPGDKPTAQVLFDVSTYEGKRPVPPELTYQIDGVWVDGDSYEDGRLDVSKLKGAGQHSLTVYFKNSKQENRWGSAGQSGKNILRVIGLVVDAGSKPVDTKVNSQWAWIVGDSITEGSMEDPDQLSSWSFFVGQGLKSLGYEYGVSACGWSGWLHCGDGAANGDVPAFYFISDSKDGKGGKYDDARSRWNKIDGNKHSLLDSKGHLSAYGEVGQEPSIILINYGTNEGLNNMNTSDIQASVQQCLEALRGAAPKAKIVLIVPFGQYEVQALRAALAAYQAAHPDDHLVQLIDLGPSVASALKDGDYWSGLHPNLRGHAFFASQILAQLLKN